MSKKQELTITYGQIVLATAVLRSLLDKPLADVRGADALKLARLYKFLEGETNLFNEQHRALIIKHGGIDVEGVLTVPPENIEAFQPEFKEMAESSVDLPFGKVPSAALNNSGMALGDMLAIEFLFE